MAPPQRCGSAKAGVSRESTRDRPHTEVEHPMGIKPKPAYRSTRVFHSRYFRSAVLFLVIFSLLPNVAFAWAKSPDGQSQPQPQADSLVAALSTEAADFIMGPQLPIGTSWFDRKEIERAKVHGAACPSA